LKLMRLLREGNVDTVEMAAGAQSLAVNRRHAWAARVNDVMGRRTPECRKSRKNHANGC